MPIAMETGLAWQRRTGAGAGWLQLSVSQPPPDCRSRTGWRARRGTMRATGVCGALLSPPGKERGGKEAAGPRASPGVSPGPHLEPAQRWHPAPLSGRDRPRDHPAQGPGREEGHFPPGGDPCLAGLVPSQDVSPPGRVCPGPRGSCPPPQLPRAGASAYVAAGQAGGQT